MCKRPRKTDWSRVLFFGVMALTLGFLLLDIAYRIAMANITP